LPKGHPGHETPHYDIHPYFVSEKDMAQICPDGETAKPGEKVLRYSRR